MNNLSSYCGLVDAKKGASDKDLPVYRDLKLFANSWPFVLNFKSFLITRTIFFSQQFRIILEAKYLSAFSPNLCGIPASA